MRVVKRRHVSPVTSDNFILEGLSSIGSKVSHPDVAYLELPENTSSRIRSVVR